MSTTLATLRTGIEFAPNSGGPKNPDIAGWRFGDFAICDDCAGRISGRGCGYMLRGAEPIWTDTGERVTCALMEFHR